MKAEIVDVSDGLSKARSIKDKKEIERISKACEVSGKAGEKIHSMIKAGMTERELAGKITSMMRETATGTAFPTIVAFGKNSSRPHHSPTDNRLGKNQFVLADFGAKFERYASDITRTFVFGKADKKMKDMYETVLDAQLQAIDMVKDGVNGKDVDKLARGIVEKKYKGKFIHSLGHEVGLSVHDGNRLSSQTDFILKENMVVTVEPGVYIPSIGGVRIEDTILVTKNKAKILTLAPKELIELIH
ncbi:MAG: aminopeptidase P family protein [Candidatus Aenigmarchaeota archaeon]|nr:aminopeptidase P family protein [Candidatus Aenigmarchaeota archaeon]